MILELKKNGVFSLLDCVMLTTVHHMANEC